MHVRPLLAFASLALCGVSQAAPQATGLPAGGGLDARKVVESRYGAMSVAGTTQRIEGALATVMIDNSAGGPAGESVPVTFGQVFAPGVLARDKKLQGATANGATLPLQVDVKALHPDGSVRNAVVSSVVPRPEKGKPFALGIVEKPSSLLGSIGDALGGAASALPDLAAIGTGASVSLTLDGKRYTATLDRRTALRPATWLAGPVANEWHVEAPLRTAAGETHPHLNVRFALRSYSGMPRARVDVTVENNWTYEPAPRNFTYDAEITLNGAPVYTRAALTHYHHARWRKLFWAGGDPGVEVRANMQDLIASRAVPNYDPSVLVAESTLAALDARWQGPRTEPMGTGEAHPAMPTTGGRADIGLLPAWTAMYILSSDTRARKVMLGTADLAGSYSAHYRDKRTGRPVSLLDYPYMTLTGTPGDTYNPATGKQELFPACAAPDACRSPNIDDVSHQPSLAYVPYLLTGDYYYLEELQFWAMYNVFNSNPGYRQNRKGLMSPEQVRGQAWALRTLAHAAWITPDSHPLKQHFLQILDSNLDWYNATYPHNPQANRLHIIVNGYALGYNEGTGMAPWMDDFFTSAMGHIAELGFAKAEPILAWKANFPVERMGGTGVCWIDAGIYTMKVRDSAAAPFYDTIAQAYAASHKPEFLTLPCAGPEMAAALGLAVGEMTGYARSEVGYPSAMQPALAYAVGATGERGRSAWERFMARPVKPDYGTMGPQFAIVPR
ncbi:hypothetical protein [Massilia sp. 9I]|uniref:RIFT barrel domain-containing protein n=1 Tax=Massilia sp. 9I TaxID=2653152 RepID=UPI0012F43C13|nr:hypothetical protein [Massilia sp. 9I]VXB39340.1 conserved exported hypothetical protein [Massilia sp. 9I]